MDNDTLIVK